MRKNNSDDVIFPGTRERLKEKINRITNTEARIWLFKRMLERGIATRDVQSFIENQAELRKEFKIVDESTLKVSMKAKLKDASLSLKTLRKKAQEIRKLLLLECDNKRHKLRRITKTLKNDSSKLKDNLINKYQKKIEHLARKQNYGKLQWPKPLIKTNPHSRLYRYKDLTIFKPSSEFPKPMKSVGPFICDKKIKLSGDEVRILSKQPKFSVRENMNEIEMLAEAERMLAKHRMNESTYRKKREKEENLKAVAQGEKETEKDGSKEALRENLINDL